MFETFVLCLLLAAFSGRAGNAPEYRNLRVRVVDEAGRPVPGTRVFLGGLERSSVDPEEVVEEPERNPGLVFRTDAQGCFTARFGKFDPYQVEETGGFDGPGYGEFHFFLSKPGWAGGVSRVILNLDADALARYWANRQPEPRPAPEDRREWQRGEFAPLVLTDSASNRPLDIVLKRGLTLRGRVVDTAGRPLARQAVGVGFDLHHGSHTGAGGAIFGQGTRTDGRGRFQIHHVYPNLFSVDVFDFGRPPYWVGTRLRGRWLNRAEDRVAPRTGGARAPADYERTIEMRIVAVRRSPFRYFGRVTDASGRAVPDAEVTAETSRRDPDAHDGLKTRTDRRGYYSLRVDSPYVNWIGARAGSLGGGVDATNREHLLPPGRYDFVLRPDPVDPTQRHEAGNGLQRQPIASGPRALPLIAEVEGPSTRPRLAQDDRAKKRRSRRASVGSMLQRLPGFFCDDSHAMAWSVMAAGAISWPPSQRNSLTWQAQRRSAAVSPATQAAAPLSLRPLTIATAICRW